MPSVQMHGTDTPKSVMLQLKVTEVTTEHQKCPKMSKNSQRAKTASVEGQSPSQKLEERPRSGLYLLN